MPRPGISSDAIDSKFWRFLKLPEHGSDVILRNLGALINESLLGSALNARLAVDKMLRSCSKPAWVQGPNSLCRAVNGGGQFCTCHMPLSKI